MNCKLSNYFYSLIVLLGLFASCDESSVSIYSLSEEDFTEELVDSLKANIEKNGGSISLDGQLKLIEGKCTIYLVNPDGDTLFTESYSATNSFSIDEQFDRELGEWVFRYQVEELDDVDPSGSLEFNLTYSD
jgi:hypothetical protein